MLVSCNQHGDPECISTVYMCECVYLLACAAMLHCTLKSTIQSASLLLNGWSSSLQAGARGTLPNARRLQHHHGCVVGLDCYMQAQEITVEVILCEYSRQLHILSMPRHANTKLQRQPSSHVAVLPSCSLSCNRRWLGQLVMSLLNLRLQQPFIWLLRQ